MEKTDVSVGNWLLTFVLMSIPLVNIIMLLFGLLEAGLFQNKIGRKLSNHDGYSNSLVVPIFRGISRQFSRINVILN